ncbi:trypsin-2 [Biomphalaria glabrata]|nr:trypsin-2-like [Biomphalaria glabrata]
MSSAANCVLLASLCMFGTAAFSLNARAALRPRILGGLEVSNRCKAPYNSIVALEFMSGASPVAFCSGHLLNTRIVVTTAYCVENLRMLGQAGLPVFAVAGERDLMGTDSEEQKIPVANYKAHPLYNDTTLDNNIGLLQLAIPVTFGACVQPYLKYEEDPNACTDIDKSCFMVGWGAYTESSAYLNSARLRAADMVVYGDFVSRILTSSQLPAGTLVVEGANIKNKACIFDWGDLIACKRNNKYVLRGLLSRYNCMTPDVPMLMTDVTLYDLWMTRCVQDWTSC